MRNQKTIYISDDMIKTYEELKENASADGRGVGDYLCRMYLEYKRGQDE